MAGVLDWGWGVAVEAVAYGVLGLEGGWRVAVAAGRGWWMKVGSNSGERDGKDGVGF